jgi:hypothetical protein
MIPGRPSKRFRPHPSLFQRDTALMRWPQRKATAPIGEPSSPLTERSGVKCQTRLARPAAAGEDTGRRLGEANT